MNTNLWVGGVVLVLILIGGYWFLQKEGATSESLGTYAYTCENGSQFTMTPSSDMGSIKLSAGSQGMFTGDVTLRAVSSARFEGAHGGSAIVFVGAGEEVQLTVGSENTVCNPVASSEMAPWNWGDAGEGGGSVQPDVRVVVGESIVGKWQSTDDAKFIREFKDGGMVVDWYEGKQVSSGTFTVYTKEGPLQVSFPLVENAVYVQLTMQGSQAEKLNFRVAKLTPEELELTYMDRGGVLKFKSIQ